MSFTLKDLIEEVREVVQDTGMDFDYVGDRHTDKKLVRYLNNAMAAAYRLRPDLFYPNVYDVDNNLPTFTEANLSDGTVFPLEKTYFNPFVEYVAGFVGLGDDEFAQDNRATALLNRFVQTLTARGA